MVKAEAVYQPLKRELKLVDRAMLQLQGLIASKAFRPGDRLPSERELGERLSVSRTVVREAMRGLSTKGLVEVRDGSGAYVRAPSTRLVSELLGICLSHIETGDVTSRHILEMRRILEIEMVGLAAARREPGDLAELRRLLNEMSQPDLSSDDWAKADVDFHRAIALASKNPLLPIVLRSIAEVLTQARRLAARLPETPRKALFHHRRIYKELERGSFAGARKAMTAHLREAERTMLRALGGLAPGRKTESRRLGTSGKLPLMRCAASSGQPE
jgi:GntR family transcriptional repressor for pyruvate dehydrogenase complex